MKIDLVALVAGISALIGAVTKLLLVLKERQEIKRNLKANLKNHILFAQTREWKNNIVRIKHPSKKKETAIKLLICTMSDVLNERAMSIVKDIEASGSYKEDLVFWHMNTIDLMYERANMSGIPKAFIDKFKGWAADEEHVLLKAVKQQINATHISFAHLVDDIFKDYVIIFGLIFNNVERLKDDFLTKLNGELDKTLNE